MKNRFISFLVILMCFSTQLAFSESYDFITKGNKVLCSNKKCPFNIKKLNNFEIEISGFSNKDKFTLIDSRSYGDYEELQHLSVFANEKPAQKEETDNKNRYVFYCDAKTNVIKITCDREISFNSITLNNSTITFDNLSLGKTAEELREINESNSKKIDNTIKYSLLSPSTITDAFYEKIGKQFIIDIDLTEQALKGVKGDIVITNLTYDVYYQEIPVFIKAYDEESNEWNNIGSHIIGNKLKISKKELENRLGNYEKISFVLGNTSDYVGKCEYKVSKKGDSLNFEIKKYDLWFYDFSEYEEYQFQNNYKIQTMVGQLISEHEYEGYAFKPKTECAAFLVINDEKIINFKDYGFIEQKLDDLHILLSDWKFNNEKNLLVLSIGNKKNKSIFCIFNDKVVESPVSLSNENKIYQFSGYRFIGLISGDFYISSGDKVFKNEQLIDFINTNRFYPEIIGKKLYYYSETDKSYMEYFNNTKKKLISGSDAKMIAVSSKGELAYVTWREKNISKIFKGGAVYTTTSNSVKSIKYSPNGNDFYWIDADNYCFYIHGGMFTSNKGFKECGDFLFSNDSKYVAVAVQDRDDNIWILRNDKFLGPFYHLSLDYHFTEDSKYFVYTANDKSITEQLK